MAKEMGGGIFTTNRATVDLLFATIVENDSQGGGGGVLAESGSTVTVWNTIIASNEDSTVTFDDVRGAFTSLGYNFVGNGKSTVSFGFTGENDQVGTTAAPLDPLLDPLADNGGPTQTHLPKIYSPVVEAGQNTGIMSTDQRGLPRISPIDGIPDIGAVEQTLLDYSTWAATAFPPGAYLDSRGPEDVPDGDGIPNGMEFVTGLAPGAHDEAPYKGRIEDGKLVLRYPIGINVSPFATAIVEGSNNMSEWSESGVELRVLEDLGAGGLVMEARLPIDSGSMVRQFLRLRLPTGMSES